MTLDSDTLYQILLTNTEIKLSQVVLSAVGANGVAASNIADTPIVLQMTQ